MEKEIDEILDWLKLKPREKRMTKKKLLDLFGVSGSLLPTKSMIEKIITVEYINMYGTNYDDSSLENAKQGAMMLANWLLNNR